MLDLAAHTNVTEERRQSTRRSLLQKVAAGEEIEFATAKPRYTIIVFTDVDCPYCRKRHSDISQLGAWHRRALHGIPAVWAEHQGVAHDGSGLVLDRSPQRAEACRVVTR